MDFQEQLNEIANGETQLLVKTLTFLSDISLADQSTLRLFWPGIAVDRREAISHKLAELAEDDIELHFTRFFQVAMDDEDAAVRESAIEGLWEDNSLTTLRLLLDHLQDDPDEGVRAAAALALSRFTYLSETGKLRNEWPALLRDALIAVIKGKGPDSEVRRRAVEALSYLSGDEEVTNIIADAYRAGGRMKASALLGMGRSMDERWEPILLHELKNEDPEIRFEAARAVGEQNKRTNVVALLPLLDDDDLEVKFAAIWSLGQLGGRVAEQALVTLREDENPAVVDAADAALEELRYAEDPLRP